MARAQARRCERAGFVAKLNNPRTMISAARTLKSFANALSRVGLKPLLARR